MKIIYPEITEEKCGKMIETLKAEKTSMKRTKSYRLIHFGQILLHLITIVFIFYALYIIDEKTHMCNKAVIKLCELIFHQDIPMGSSLLVAFSLFFVVPLAFVIFLLLNMALMKITSETFNMCFPKYKELEKNIDKLDEQIDYGNSIKYSVAMADQLRSIDQLVLEQADYYKGKNEFTVRYKLNGFVEKLTFRVSDQIKDKNIAANMFNKEGVIDLTFLDDEINKICMEVSDE